MVYIILRLIFNIYLYIIHKLIYVCINILCISLYIKTMVILRVRSHICARLFINILNIIQWYACAQLGAHNGRGRVSRWGCWWSDGVAG